MTPILSRAVILEWLQRVVPKGGDPFVPPQSPPRQISPVAVARLCGFSERFLRYLARGERKLGLKAQRSLSRVIADIESGRIRFRRVNPLHKPRVRVVYVENPLPQRRLRVVLGSGPALRVMPAFHMEPGMPSARQVFSRKR